MAIARQIKMAGDFTPDPRLNSGIWFGMDLACVDRQALG